MYHLWRACLSDTRLYLCVCMRLRVCLRKRASRWRVCVLCFVRARLRACMCCAWYMCLCVTRACAWGLDLPILCGSEVRLCVCVRACASMCVCLGGGAGMNLRGKRRGMGGGKGGRAMTLQQGRPARSSASYLFPLRGRNSPPPQSRVAFGPSGTGGGKCSPLWPTRACLVRDRAREVVLVTVR